MKHSFLTLILLILFAFLTGCTTIFVPVDTPTPAPTAILLPTSAPSATAAQSVATTSQFAPTCAADPLVTACALPKVDERDKYCIEKIPYTQFATAPGVTFEAVDPGLKCTDQGIREGSRVIACTGTPLFSYSLKICSSSCNASALTVDAAKCPTGSGYSADAGCCWPMPSADAGCVLVKVNISACK